MLRKFATSLGLGVAGGVLAATLKWAGAFTALTAFLYDFYDQGDIFARVHGVPEFFAAQLAILFLAGSAMALAIATIPNPSRRAIIVLGAVLVTFFLSPVLALFGWKVEPFSWLVGLLCASASAVAVFPVRALPAMPDAMEATPQPGSEPPGAEAVGDAVEMAAVASVALQPPAEAVPDVPPGSRTTPATNHEGNAARREATFVVCSVFPPTGAMDGYAGAARAFMERARTFLLSAGAVETEPGPDFVRALFSSSSQPDGPAGLHAHSREACEAALMLTNHLDAFVESSDSEATRALRFGLGLESAVWPAVAPEAPLESRDFARKLCRLNQCYGSGIIIGPRAQRLAAKAIEVRPLELTNDPTTGIPVEIYELLGKAGCLAADAANGRDAFWEGIVCLRSGLTAEALERLAVARASGSGSDPVLDYFEAVAQGKRPGDGQGEGRDPQSAEDNPGEVDTDPENGPRIQPALAREREAIDAVEWITDTDEEAAEIPSIPDKQ